MNLQEKIKFMEQLKTSSISNITDEQYEDIKDWITEYIHPRKTILHGHSSYGLKHRAEEALGFYIHNNDIIRAMIDIGFNFKPNDELNPINYKFNISNPSMEFLYAIANSPEIPRGWYYKMKSDPKLKEMINRYKSETPRYAKEHQRIRY